MTDLVSDIFIFSALHCGFYQFFSLATLCSHYYWNTVSLSC